MLLRHLRFTSLFSFRKLSYNLSFLLNKLHEVARENSIVAVLCLSLPPPVASALISNIDGVLRSQKRRKRGGIKKNEVNEGG